MEDHGFTMTVEPSMVGPENWDNFTGTSWTCTLQRNGRAATVQFHQGSAYKDEPAIEDVLSCVLRDIEAVQNAHTFEDWADDYGLDTDSRKAERIYKAVLEQAAHFVPLIGGDLDALLEMFQDY